MTPAEIVTTVLSGLAFVMSVVALGWQIRQAKADRPWVHVTGVVGCTVMQNDYSTACWSFDISVANTGSEAITIDEVCWIIEMQHGGTVRVKSSVVTEHMPIRLEGKDSRSWTYEISLQGSWWDGLTGRPSAVIVQRPSRWRKSSQSVQRTLLGRPQVLLIPEAWKPLIKVNRLS
ncbi:hypothetical protein [Microbacterium sp. NPDC077057]|uniref:hypothetical protein n=1 Tax=unclassified Microbacterium TaxID=2609290 RepID=UPI00343B6590